MAPVEDLAKWPRRGPDLRFAPGQAPQLCIVVHTEEEFDWDAPFDRAANTVKHIPELARFQDVAEARGFAPHYSCGFPVTQDEDAVSFLGALKAEARASIGAHLHPWVCPPYAEDVSNFNSFPGNLPQDIEAKKLAALTEALTQAFGDRPTAYLAGRYGFGPNTADTLAALGYKLDFSVAPGWDYRRYDGPNWRDHSAFAFFNAAHPDLLHVPHSGGHIGFLCKGGLRSLPLNENGAAGALRLPSIAARLGAVRQARLTIEGMTLPDMIALATALYNAGARLFTLSFHSPSAGVGYTPYAPDAKARDAMADTMGAFLDFFRSDLGGEPGSPESLYAAALGARTAQAA